MSQLGFGVMLGMLGGNKNTVNAVQESLGKKIASVVIDDKAREDGALVFSFEDGTVLHVWDGGRSCCESRYMHTDDDLTGFVGATLVGIDVQGQDTVEDEEGYGDVTESLFLIVRTDKGDFTVVTYNHHNGYYGGFWLCASTDSNALDED